MVDMTHVFKVIVIVEYVNKNETSRNEKYAN